MKARYIAKDKNGGIYLYSHKPTLYPDGEFGFEGDRDVDLLEITPEQAEKLLGYRLTYKHGVVKL